MKKSGTARLLITATILLIILFQVYWLKKLYGEENDNFKKTVDLIFRECMYRLQVERFKNDTTAFHTTVGDNLFVSDLISSVIKEGKTPAGSGDRKLTVSINRHTAFDDDFLTDSFKRDTIVYINNEGANNPSMHIARLLEDEKGLNDSIPLKRIDSLYRSLLVKEGIKLGYRIKTSLLAANKREAGLYATKKVPVGILKPVFYQAVFNDPSSYIIKKIGMQLFLSLLLVALTTVSFIFMYRNLLAQKRLTAIKNEFINNMTHELKTPIATVNVAIEALRDFGGLKSPEKTKEYLDISALELQRLSMLVDKVLKLSMFENKEIALQKETFDLLQLVQEVMVSMKLQFDKLNAEVKAEPSGKNFIIEADKLHMTSVIYNLLDNALKYSKENAHITIQLLDQANYLELRVTDNGIGIADEYRQKIFEQFFRVPDGNQHNIKGYGLGLSYVNHIIKRHMGFIEVETAPGKGSTFIIKIPFAEAPVIYYDKKRSVYKEQIKL